MNQNNPLFDLADKLKNLRAVKVDLEADLKELNGQISDTEYELSNMMAETETQNFTRAGTMFYLSTRTHASPVGGAKDDLHAALKEQGFGDLVTETVHHQSLSSFVKEQIEENGDELPDWLTGLVNVFDKTTVGVRKAK